MKVLKAIGGFFCRIGRWIRDTAWVQPLLIVGGIFAIIFSIPYIVDAVESNFKEGDEASAYFEKYQLSLEGASTKSSEADELMKYVIDRSIDDNIKNEKFGDQFFVAFVENNCAGCKETYPAFQTMEQKMKDGSFKSTTDVKNFKLFTIFIDEVTEKDELKGEEKTFSKYFNPNYLRFFEECATVTAKRPYYINNAGDDSSSSYHTSLEGLTGLTAFPTPGIFMFDFNAENAKGEPLAEDFGIVDIIFQVEGKGSDSSTYGVAATLMDCWNHTGIFEEIGA